LDPNTCYKVWQNPDVLGIHKTVKYPQIPSVSPKLRWPMPNGIVPLTDAKVKSAKAQERPIRLYAPSRDAQWRRRHGVAGN